MCFLLIGGTTRITPLFLFTGGDVAVVIAVHVRTHLSTAFGHVSDIPYVRESGQTQFVQFCRDTTARQGLVGSTTVGVEHATSPIRTPRQEQDTCVVGTGRALVCVCVCVTSMHKSGCRR